MMRRCDAVVMSLGKYVVPSSATHHLPRALSGNVARVYVFYTCFRYRELRDAHSANTHA